jgi:hypothetical protein
MYSQRWAGSSNIVFFEGRFQFPEGVSKMITSPTLPTEAWRNFPLHPYSEIMVGLPGVKLCNFPLPLECLTLTLSLQKSRISVLSFPLEVLAPAEASAQLSCYSQKSACGSSFWSTGLPCDRNHLMHIRQELITTLFSSLLVRMGETAAKLQMYWRENWKSFSLLSPSISTFRKGKGCAQACQLMSSSVTKQKWVFFPCSSWPRSFDARPRLSG